MADLLSTHTLVDIIECATKIFQRKLRRKQIWHIKNRGTIMIYSLFLLLPVQGLKWKTLRCETVAQFLILQKWSTVQILAVTTIWNAYTVLWTSKNVCSLHRFFLQMWNTITKLFITIFWIYIAPTIKPLFYVPHFAFSMILCTFCSILAKCL